MTANNVTLAMMGDQGENPFVNLFMHVLPHKLEGVELFGLPVYNLQIFQILSVVLVLVLFAGVARNSRQETGGKLARILAGFVGWIRDEMVFPYLGHKDGTRLLPYFLSVFFFILFMNLLGLVPYGATATASIFVTAGMASLTLLAMLGLGMFTQGPIKFWANLVPHGIPAPLLLIMVPVELVGLLVKPFALTIRLFANMTGGHLVVLSFMGLIYYFGQTFGAAVGWGVSLPSVGLAVFIMIIEGFVALLQAYIFTLLTIIFVSMSMHPDH